MADKLDGLSMDWGKSNYGEITFSISGVFLRAKIGYRQAVFAVRRVDRQRL